MKQGKEYQIIIRTTLAILMTLVITGCGEADEWVGFLYPNKNNLSQHIETGTYATIKECRRDIVTYAHDVGFRGYDYECGLNCEHQDGMGSIMVCEETSR